MKYTLIRLITAIIFLMFAIAILQIMDSGFGELNNCNEEKEVYYRVVGTGGWFGGTEEVITQNKELADGKKMICIRWKGLILNKEYNRELEE